MVKYKTMSGVPDYTHKLKKHDQLEPSIIKDRNLSLAKKILSDQHLLDVLKKLNVKFFQLVEAQAILNLCNKNKFDLSKKSIASIGSTKITLEVNCLLTNIIGKKNKDDQKVEFGNLDESGYFGMNPLAIRNVIFKNGNFRERIYIFYRDGYSGFSEKIFSNPTQIDKINKILELNNADWIIDKEFIQTTCKESHSSTPYTRGIYSRFVRDEGLRIARTAKETEICQLQHNPRINEDHKRLTALSEREKIAKTGESPNTPLFGYQAQKIDPYISGSALYKSSDIEHPFMKMNEEIGEEFCSGASGIVDTILTLAMCLGSTEKELIILRDAACASMIEDKSHSPHEVYFSAKTFGLPYEPGELNTDLKVVAEVKPHANFKKIK